MKKIFLFITKFIFVFLVTLILFELFLRYSEISNPSNVKDDPRFGTVFKPNTDMMIIKEGFYMGKINSYGYIGPDYPPERKKGSLRIALMGDSYVESFHLFENYHFRSVMEKELSELTDKKVEILNFGRAGFDLQTIYIHYKGNVKKYSPDITLLFLASEDFKIMIDNENPYCYLDSHKIKINYDFIHSNKFKLLTKYSFIRSSSLYTLIQNCYALFRKGETSQIVFDKLNIFSSDKKKEIKKKTISRDLVELTDEKKVIKGILENLFYENSHNSAKILIVKRKDLGENYTNVLEKFKIIPLSDKLESYTLKGFDLNYWKAIGKDGHWNHLAHNIIGKYLASEIYLYLKAKNFRISKYCNEEFTDINK